MYCGSQVYVSRIQHPPSSSRVCQKSQPTWPSFWVDPHLLVFKQQPYGPFPDLRGITLRLVHAPILSRSGASGKLGSIHSAPSTFHQYAGPGCALAVRSTAASFARSAWQPRQCAARARQQGRSRTATQHDSTVPNETTQGPLPSGGDRAVLAS